jgi:acyl homoserine lactone synthase
MYLLVQAHQFEKFSHLIDQSFLLRKRVFADRLGWKVAVSGEMEKDLYDTLNPAYLFWCDDEGKRLYGTVRLLPTTGPTLLYDVFRKTFPNSCDLVAPTIWEGTRMCIDEDAISRDMPELRPDQAFCQLLLALCEVALDHGIETLVSNYEPHLKRLYERAGAELEELGRATGFGRFPVCCGIFEVSPRILRQMRTKLEVSEPLYRRSYPTRRQTGQPTVRGERFSERLQADISEIQSDQADQVQSRSLVMASWPSPGSSTINP